MKKYVTPSPKTMEESLRVILTDARYRQIATNQQDALAAIDKLKADQKRINDDYKAKIAAQEAIVTETRNALNAGYEFAEVQVVVTYDSPEKGYKTTIRSDTGEVVRKEKMTYEELQPALPMEEKPEPPKPGEGLNRVSESLAAAEHAASQQQAGDGGQPSGDGQPVPEPQPAPVTLAPAPTNGEPAGPAVVEAKRRAHDEAMQQGKE